MFDIFLDALKRLIKSRLFPIAFIYIVLFGILINRLFVLQIVEGPTHAEEYEYRNTESREIKVQEVIYMTVTECSWLQTPYHILSLWRIVLK